MPARKVGRLILVDEAALEPTAVNVDTAVVYARVSSVDRPSDLDQQIARVAAWATGGHNPT